MNLGKTSNRRNLRKCNFFIRKGSESNSAEYTALNPAVHFVGKQMYLLRKAE